MMELAIVSNGARLQKLEELMHKTGAKLPVEAAQTVAVPSPMKSDTRASERVARAVAAALNAESTGQILKATLLSIRPQPLLTKCSEPTLEQPKGIPHIIFTRPSKPKATPPPPPVEVSSIPWSLPSADASPAVPPSAGRQGRNRVASHGPPIAVHKGNTPGVHVAPAAFSWGPVPPVSSPSLFSLSGSKK
ncbi:hypothetical protein SISSUDRAFT_352828 [Sistotremastrum suecicum HHB10207 ss-3]|uniref:Uncharacterized protein n=1 Tax=Sistotremastrum suecicum HHB10207 ss-3 TaxID=1314776 RepID=A0A166G3W0_9AGAM|nr:hypothetical protein SISSUDRAFT_352828 [Sistotremastrum suecicum HHB10207 ss-3]